jgi:hypothetical protein
MATWRLIYNGQIRTLADWGVSQLRLNRVSQGLDTLTFVADGKLFDSAQDFAFGGTVLITKDAKIWFVGTVIRVPRQASTTESLTYTVAGPWYWLDQLIFKLVWQYRNGSTNVAVPLASSHIFLNVSNGVWVHTGAMITGAINYAISRGAPMQVGTISPALFPPIDEVRDITCGEVIRKMLRWHPRAVTWWDYSTSPYPTFHCRSEEELPAVALSLPPDATGPQPSSHEVNALYEAVRPSVCVNYERTNTINDESFVRLIQDIAPGATDSAPAATGDEIGCWTVTVDLQGTKTTVAEAEIVCEQVPDTARPAPLPPFSDAEKLAWLVAHVPELQDPNITGLTLLSFARRLGGSGFTNELTSGALADWMHFQSEDDVIFARVTYSYRALDGTTIMVTAPGGKTVQARFKATNASTGTYRSRTVDDNGDPIPVGVAAYLYDQVKTLRYGGSFELTAAELSVPPSVSLGNTVNLLGARPEWATMKGLVQQLTEELDTGRTTITFGPPGHLGPADLIELTRINRHRKRETPTDAMTSGRATSGTVKLGEKTPNNDSNHGDADLSLRLVRDGLKVITLNATDGVLGIIDSAAPAAKGVNIATAACVGGGVNRVLTVREVGVCENNVTRKMLVVGSVSYD